MIFVLTLIGSMIPGYAVLVEPRLITIAEYEIVSENLPQAFEGTRIALLTDIHHGSRYSCNLLDQIVRMTRNQSPDLILLGGDYVRERPQFLAECFAKLSELDAPLGVYAVLGNHDCWNMPLMRSTIHDAGIELLENNTVWLEKGDEQFLLVGIKDLWTDQTSLTGMRQELAKSRFTVLLSHNPDFYKQLTPNDRSSIDLILSGHTHGGQITVFGQYVPKKMADERFISGLIKPDTGRTRIIVSNGIGTVGMPIRFFARPQIVLVTLKKKK